MIVLSSSWARSVSRISSLTDHFRERSRAKVQLASAVLRQLEFARNLEDKEDIARGIRQTVKTFQFLLFEQNRPAI